MTAIVRALLGAALGAIAMLPAQGQDETGAYRVVGSETVELTAGPANTAILLSPEGTRALHVTGTGLCVFAIDGRDWTQQGCRDVEPAGILQGADDMRWSPDGTRVLLPTFAEAFRHLRETDLFLLEIDSLALSRLTGNDSEASLLSLDAPAEVDAIARWLDDETIVFVRHITAPPGVGNGVETSLMRVASDGTGIETIAELPSGSSPRVYAMEPSADGTRIAYAVDEAGATDGEGGVYVLDLPGGESARVLEPVEGMESPLGLAFSADGSKLLLTSAGPESTVDARVLDLQTGALHAVAPARGVSSAAWSPAGAALAYTVAADLRGEGGGLWIAADPMQEGTQVLDRALIGPSCCGVQPFVWAGNDTMVLSQPQSGHLGLYIALEN